MTKMNPNNGSETKPGIFPWSIFKSDTKNITKYYYLFYQKILKCFNNFQNRNFSVLWLKWIKAMEMKQNQTFFSVTYSNLTPHLFISKNIKVLRWLSKSKFHGFLTPVNSNSGNETKSNIFLLTYSNLTSVFIHHKIRKYFN